MKHLIIYGPQGCGKTKNAEALRQKFGMTRIVNEWNEFEPLRDGVLALTNSQPPFDYPSLSYDEAMAK